MFPNSKWYLFWKYNLACKINKEIEVVQLSCKPRVLDAEVTGSRV